MTIIEKRKISVAGTAFSDVESALNTVYTADARALNNTYVTDSTIQDGDLILTRTFPDADARALFDTAREDLVSNNQYHKIEVEVWEPVE